MTDLIARLEAGTTEQERDLIEEAIEHAWTAEWISDEQSHRALSLLMAGGFVDAAMLAVPEGWVQGRLAWPGYDEGVWKNHARADLHHMLSSGGGPKVTTFAATPALALCAAAMKAQGHE